MSAEQKVRNYVLENFLFSNDQALLANDDSFIKKGIMDSTGMMEMIYFLEDEFSIKISDNEMVPQNLDSVNNIVQFVAKKLAK